MSDPKLQFISSRSPTFKAGEYTLEFEQTITVDGAVHAPAPPAFSFAIQAERFLLPEDQIAGVFPAPGSMADDGYVLPHVQLQRATLPWERSPFPTAPAGDTTPWLALLVFQDDEVPPVVSGKSVSQLHRSLALEAGQQGDDPVRVIQVPTATAQAMLPDADGLMLLAHCRKRTDADELTAVVVASRMPEFGKNTTVFLVSLEGLYDPGDRKLNPANAVDGNLEFVVLYQWNFTAAFPDSDFQATLAQLHMDALRLPGSETSPDVATFLNQGYTALPHRMRQGSSSVTWYRGPLLPGANDGTAADAGIQFPVGSADDLFIFYKDTGMFDVSYAAAYELGRMTLLNDTKVATDFLRWKRTWDLALAAEQQAAGVRHLPARASVAPPEDLPDSVKAFFAVAAAPENLPWEYLLSDANMLPAESIRFCVLDPIWRRCFLDGAFSLGTVSPGTQQRIADYNPALKLPATESGFFLRSTVVSRYPALEIRGTVNGNESVVKPGTIKKIAPDVLLVLFEGSLESVSLFLALHVLHFALESDDKGKTFYVDLRDKLKGSIIGRAPVSFLADAPLANLIDLSTLAKNILTGLKQSGSLPSDQFALQMLAVPDGMRFKRD